MSVTVYWRQLELLPVLTPCKGTERAIIMAKQTPELR